MFVPYALENDEACRMVVLTARTASGEFLAVVSEPTLEAAEVELFSVVEDVLHEYAHDLRDPFQDLAETPPRNGGFLTFLPSHLFPVRLTLARAQVKLKQSDMAARLGITQQAYAKLEGPGANPTLQTIMQLERVLGRELVAWAI